MNSRTVIERVDDDPWPVAVAMPSGNATDEHALIGSEAWILREERRAAEKGRRFSPIAILKNRYRYYDELADEQINSGGETETGKTLHPGLVNRLELADALHRLPETERHAWILHTIDEMGYTEIAQALKIREDAVRQAVSRAGRALAARIMDPVF